MDGTQFEERHRGAKSYGIKLEPAGIENAWETEDDLEKIRTKGNRNDVDPATEECGQGQIKMEKLL